MRATNDSHEEDVHRESVGAIEGSLGEAIEEQAGEMDEDMEETL